MTERTVDREPLILFLPHELDPEAFPEWRSAVRQELAQRQVSTRESGVDGWDGVLTEAAAAPLAGAAVGKMLMIVPDARPVYLWLTLAEPGAPEELVRNLLGHHMGRELEDALPALDSRGHSVHAGWGTFEAPIAEGTKLVVLVAAAAVTLTTSTRGTLDVCLWYLHDNLEAGVEALPMIVDFITRDSLPEFLTL